MAVRGALLLSPPSINFDVLYEHLSGKSDVLAKASRTRLKLNRLGRTISNRWVCAGGMPSDRAYGITDIREHV